MYGSIHKLCFSCVSNKAKNIPVPPKIIVTNNDDLPDNWEDESNCSKDMNIEHIITNIDVDPSIYEPWN